MADTTVLAFKEVGDRDVTGVLIRMSTPSSSSLRRSGSSLRNGKGHGVLLP